MNPSMIRGKWSSWNISEFTIMDFIEKNAIVFAKVVQYLNDKSLSLVIRNARDNGRKATTILRKQYLSKGKLNIISLYIELTSLRRLESESIIDYIIRTENISHALKEAREVISDGFLIAMVLKGLPPNFRLFTTVITQKKKILTFSEFKLCLRSYEEIEGMCYHPPDESNSILQMKTTFKKIKPRNKLGVSTHSRYDFKSTNYNNYQKPQHSREGYNISIPGKTNIIICYIYKRKDHKAFQFQNWRQKDFCQNIRKDLFKRPNLFLCFRIWYCFRLK